MDAVYISATEFRVQGDHTAEFISGRRLRANCDVDGYKYSTIQSSSYLAPNTYVTIAEAELTSNLFEVHYGIVSQGSTGSLPNHDHSGLEGEGSRLSYNNLNDRPSIPDTFLDLSDTPSAYDDGKQLVSTSSGIAFEDVTTVSGPKGADGVDGEDGATWYVETTDPTALDGKDFDNWLNETDYEVFTKDNPGWSGNLAQGKTATARDSGGNTPDRAVDGSYSTYWRGSSSNNNQWWQVDLAAEYQINRMTIQNHFWKSIDQFELRASNSSDNSNYEVLVSATHSEDLETTTTYDFLSNTNTYRYYRVHMFDPENQGAISECELYSNDAYEWRSIGSIKGEKGDSATASGISFLDLDDTPTTYSGSEGNLLYSTGSGIAFSDLSIKSVDSDYYALEFVREWTVTSGTFDTTLSGIQGDTYDEWVFTYQVENGGNGNAGVYVELNGDSTSGNYEGTSLYARNSAADSGILADRDNLLVTYTYDTPKSYSAADTNFYLKSGTKRIANALEGRIPGDATTDASNIHFTSAWKNTVDEVTTMRVFTNGDITGYVRLYRKAQVSFPYTTISGGGGSSDVQSFLDLEDTPTTYSGAADYYLKVNSTASGIEFVAADTSGQVPTGGTLGQVLMKESAVDGDYDWKDYRQFHTSSGIPSSILGNATDHCVDVITGDIYQKGPGGEDLSDEFNGNDNDPPNSVLWDIYSSTLAGNGQACFISGNALRTYQQGSTSGANNYYYGVKAKTALIGDFIVEAFVTDWTGTANRASLHFGAEGIGDIHLYDDGTKYVRTHDGSNYHTTNINSNPYNITLRLERSGTTFSVQYKQDGIGSFTTLASWTVSSADAKATLRSQVYDSSSYMEGYWDYYRIISGGVADPWQLQRDNPETFIELKDTPATYSGSDGQYLVSTGSGIAFSDFSIKSVSTDYYGYELVNEYHLQDDVLDVTISGIAGDVNTRWVIESQYRDTGIAHCELRAQLNGDETNYYRSWLAEQSSAAVGNAEVATTHLILGGAGVDDYHVSITDLFLKTGFRRVAATRNYRHDNPSTNYRNVSYTSYWTDTTNEVDTIRLFTSDEATGYVKVYRQSKIELPVVSDRYEDSDYYVKELIEEWNLAGGSIDESFEWDGENEEVFVEFAFSKDGTDASRLQLRPNGDGGANYTSNTITANTSGNIDSTYNSSFPWNSMLIAGESSTTLLDFRGEFYTNLKLADVPRKANTNYYRSDSTQWNIAMSTWENTSDKVTSVNLILTGENTGWVKLYKRRSVDIPIVKEPVGNWILVEDVVASGTNWSHSVDWEGDSWPRAKVETYNQSAAATITMQFNNDNGSNYYDAYLYSHDDSVTTDSSATNTSTNAPIGFLAGRDGMTICDMYLKTGSYRSLIASSSVYDSSNPDIHYIRQSTMWANTNDEVTSLDFAGDTSDVNGYNIKVYRWQDITDVNSGVVEGLPAGIQTIKTEHFSGNEFFINPGTVDIYGNFYKHEERTVVSGTGLTASTWYYIYAKAPTTRRGLKADDFSYETIVPEMDWDKLGYYHKYIKTKRCIGYFYSSSTSNVKEWKSSGHKYNFLGGSGILTWATHTDSATFTAYVPLGGEEVFFKARFGFAGTQEEVYVSNPDTSSRVHMGTAQTSSAETIHMSYNCSANKQLTLERASAGTWQGDVVQDGFSISDYIYTG